jgi:glycosyltransferase involved in cell wall biosynthesis
MKFSIIITTLNEVDTIDEFIRRIDSAFAQIDDDYELIFIDDCSTDGSQDKIINHSIANPKIKLIEMSRRFGRHNCYHAGFKFASGDAAIIMDSDLQDPPELIPELIAFFKQENADVVHTIMQKREKESVFKLFLTSISYKILNHICYIKMPANAGQFKVISKSVIEELEKMGEHDTYYKGLINWVGFNQVEYPFIRQGRSAGATKFSLWGMRPYSDLIKAITSFSYLPLYLPLIATLLSSILLIMSFISNDELFIIRLIVFFLFFILMILAFISLYLVQVHASTRARPLYIIKRKFGF